MKRILLSSLFAVFCFLANAQTENFDNAFPAGWMVNESLKLTRYSVEPNCGVTSTGLVTPTLVGGTETHLLTSPVASSLLPITSLSVSFDAFAFAANQFDLNCAASAASFNCTKRVRVYIVPGTYSSTARPTGANVLGQADVAVSAPGTNTINVTLASPLAPGTQYRVFFEGRTIDCNSTPQQLVMDNITIRQDVQTATFDGSTLPAGWDFAVPDIFAIRNYNTPDPGCSNNVGLATSTIIGNFTAHIATSPAVVYNTTTTSFRVRFDFFAFNANSNLECAAAMSSITCPTTVKAYIVPGNYTGHNTPTGANVIGMAQLVLTPGNNTIVVPVPAGTALTTGASYRLYIEGVTGTCGNGTSQRYVVDNLEVSPVSAATTFEESFPAGWTFNREVRITQYQDASCSTPFNTGLALPPLSSNITSFVAASPATNYSPTTGTLNLAFDLFAFAPGATVLSCANAQTSIACQARARVYIVPSTYTSMEVPTGANLLGMTEATLQPGANVIAVPVTGTFSATTQYRLMIVGLTGTCTTNFQQLVVDNIRILEIERAILPVSLTVFNAARKNSVVTLTWETSQEINNRGFHLQRNINGEWKNVAFIFSKADGGNSSSNLSYAYNDQNTHTGVSQYRLLQVDIDGKGKYSEIRSVRGEAMANRLAVYPNPSVNGKVNILFEDATSTRDVIVSDVAGRVVKQYKNIGANSLTIENLVDGYYTIQVTNRTTQAIAVEKVIVKKR